MRLSNLTVLITCLALFGAMSKAQITFQLVNQEVYLRFGGNNIIELTGAEQVELLVGETVNYFGSFIIVRDANSLWKHPQGFFNSLTQLGLAFDEFTVTIQTSTRVVYGPGVLYVNTPIAFFTTSSVLVARIEEALQGDPGNIPTPPPNQGSWSSWGPWSSCSVSCDSGFRTRERVCTGCTASCCVCPPGETFQIEECLVLFCEGQWSSWSPFSSCSRTCGGGFRTRERVCEGNGPCSLGESFEHLGCNTQSCCN